jgi:hypothetical protein
MKTMTLNEFHEACQAQATANDQIVFRCPMCKTLQSGADLIRAGAGPTFDDVEKYLGFSCIGRFTGALSPRKQPDGKPCNWTLGGLFRVHTFEVVTPDGKHHPRFELASKDDADQHRLAMHEGGAS